MAQGQPIPPAAPTSTSALALDAASKPLPTEAAPQRTSERLPAREYYRSMARRDPTPSNELKYHIDKRDFVPDCDHVWVPIRVNGMDSGQLRLYLSNGWVPARACDFPKHSGYGAEVPEQLRLGGYMPNVQADDVIEKDGEMLLLRPEELSRKADDERLRDARLQVDTQMRRLELASRRSMGSKADDLVKVQYGRQFANPDTFRDVASDKEV